MLATIWTASKSDQCKFFPKTVDYLGHCISPEGIQPTQERVKGILAASIPSNKSELQSFMGLMAYNTVPVPTTVVYSPASTIQVNTEGYQVSWSRECSTSSRATPSVIPVQWYSNYPGIHNNKRQHRHPTEQFQTVTITTHTHSEYSVTRVTPFVIQVQWYSNYTQLNNFKPSRWPHTLISWQWIICHKGNPAHQSLPLRTWPTRKYTESICTHVVVVSQWNRLDVIRMKACFQLHWVC